jgi:deoxyribonucleoside regulator
MSSRLDVQLIVKVAQMYYLDGLKQEEIAKQIGISRSLISMILTEAKERGIVEIAVRDPFLNDEELSGALASHHPKVTFTVIPTSSRDPTARRKLVAQRAADILARSLKGGEVLGLAWGRTCLELVNAFHPVDERLRLSVVPLIGGSSQTAPYFQINELVRVLAERGGGTPYFIHAPALVADRRERDLYVNGSAMQPIRQRWKKMDVVVTAIGALGGDHPDRESYLGEGEAQRDVRERDAAGDLSARYFDHRGRFIQDEFYERVVGVPVEDLRAARSAVCMASGVEKADAIVAALKTGVPGQLIMDEPTARAALELLRATED